jgi:hypothetical protein
MVQTEAADNMKRVVSRVNTKWADDVGMSPYMIRDTQETKTTWHPIGS